MLNYLTCWVSQKESWKTHRYTVEGISVFVNRVGICQFHFYNSKLFQLTPHLLWYCIKFLWNASYRYNNSAYVHHIMLQFYFNYMNTVQSCMMSDNLHIITLLGNQLSCTRKNAIQLDFNKITILTHTGHIGKCQKHYSPRKRQKQILC